MRWYALVWYTGTSLGLEIIRTLLSGRLPYQYAVGRSIAAKFTVHFAVHEIWSVDCQENH